jgi:signal transduction histidine kinase
MKTKREFKSLTIVVVSKSADFSNNILDLLSDVESNHNAGLDIARIRTVGPQEEVISGAHIAILDSDAIESKPVLELGKFIRKLRNAPVIYVTDPLNSAEEIDAVKSIAAEYITKSSLTGQSLRNCIRWVLQYSHLELALEQQNHRYESLFYNAVDPSFFLSPDWTINQVNDAFVSTFGRPRETLQGMAFSNLLNESRDFDEIKQKFTEEGQDHVNCEVKFSRLDQNSRFLGHLKLTSSSQYAVPGNKGTKSITGYQGSLTNIGYRERLRKIKDRADRVDMTYRLARTLAHEIRNPLTNINLALETIKDTTKVDTEAADLLDLVKRSSHRINSLIDQLLTSSERSKLTINDCDLVSLLKDVIEEAKDRATLVQAELKTDFDATDFNYPCDSQKIKLAISNLVCNAIESIQGDGGIITLGTYKDDEYLVIYVEDNGSGMSEDVKKSLFDPFFTNKENGIGLGLTSAQTIIAEHEGEIEVETAEGHGSTFSISLPMRNASSYNKSKNS